MAESKGPLRLLKPSKCCHQLGSRLQGCQDMRGEGEWAKYFDPSSWGNEDGAEEGVRSKAAARIAGGRKRKGALTVLLLIPARWKLQRTSARPFVPIPCASPGRAYAGARPRSAMGGSCVPGTPRSPRAPAKASLRHLLLCSRASVSSPAMIF